MIIPRKAILELQKTTIDYDSTVEVQAGKNYFQLILPSYQFASKLIDASYPDYICVIPKNNSESAANSKSDLQTDSRCWHRGQSDCHRSYGWCCRRRNDHRKQIIKKNN